jgi:hypothetical protein
VVCSAYNMFIGKDRRERKVEKEGEIR